MHLILLAAVFVHTNVAHLHHHPHRIIAPTEPVGGQLKNIVVTDSNISLPYNSYSKHQPGRHICITQKNVTIPVTTKEAFCKPVYKKYIERCYNNQLCTGVRLVYETAYRDVIIKKTTNYDVYICCPGWSQIDNRSYGCNKPRCSMKCQNGGSCMMPDLCKCLKGFTGRYCEIDIDECREQKPCDQICYNTVGSYRCECREQFYLLSDGQSCRKKDGDGSALEAKDLEYELYNKQLFVLETLLAAKQLNATIISTNGPSSQTISHNILLNILKDSISLKSKLKEFEDYQKEVVILKDKIIQLEEKADKVDKILAKYNGTKTCVLTNKYYVCKFKK